MSDLATKEDSTGKPSGTPSPGDILATTHWSVVLAAAGKPDTHSQAALEELCRTYWFPLYAYVRRHGHTREEAEDLTQEFFRRFLERKDLESVSSERGKFRAFLLASLKHFLLNQWDRAKCKKRGGSVPHLSLDWSTADTQFQVAADTALTPDKLYDREWAVALLARVVERLRDECRADGKEAQFQVLKEFLGGSASESSYANAAARLQMEETAARVAAHRLRKRYRQILRIEIASTLADPSQVEEEIRSLFGAFGK
jgi:RNA polymerase sigma-70 factor (ECF subfamily)